MSDAFLRAAAALVAIVGIGVSAYLLYARYADTTLACATGGCETVQSSRYAEVLGIPVAALGLAAFLTLTIVSLRRGDLARTMQAVVALAAAGFSTYLLYVQIALIGEICDWCVVNDVVVSAAAVLALARLRLQPA